MLARPFVRRHLAALAARVRAGGMRRQASFERMLRELRLSQVRRAWSRPETLTLIPNTALSACCVLRLSQAQRCLVRNSWCSGAFSYLFTHHVVACMCARLSPDIPIQCA